MMVADKGCTDHSTQALLPMAAQYEAGDLLVDYLGQLGVEYVFGVPGGAIEPLYNALARSARRGGPRAIVARHENGAAFMADGYSRQTGRLGVCCATTGPGTTNLITGAASCHQNRVPLLVVTAQTALPVFGKGALQDSSCTGINTLGMLSHCTRYNTLVSEARQFEFKLIQAVMIAFRSRTVSHLSIPRDILGGKMPVTAPTHDLARLLRMPPILSAESFEWLRAMVTAARNPVIILGGGAEGAIDAILAFAIQRDIPVLTTPHGKGLVSAYHPLYRGIFGFAGHTSARELLAAGPCDLVLAVGTLMAEWDSGNWDKQALLNERLIQIDETDEYFARAPMARLQVQGHIGALFEKLAECLPASSVAEARHQTKGGALLAFPLYPPLSVEHEDVSWLDDSAGPIKPQRLMCELSKRFPSRTLFLADPGNSLAWAIHYLHPRDRRITGPRPTGSSTFRSSLEFASMGWAIGAAIGAALSDRRRPVVCITGDGSFLMSGQELTVAVQERLSVIFVVLNDGALGMVKHGQRLAGAEPVGFELPPVDFAAMARAMGARAFTIHEPGDLAEIDIGTLCSHPGPSLLDVYIDREEIPPMRARVQALAKSMSGVTDTISVEDLA